MPPVIVTADNIPDVLSQIAERQDEQAAAIELLAGQLADQSIRTDQQDEALRTQAAALRVTAVQLSRNISDTAKAAGGNVTDNRSPGDRSQSRSAADDDDDDDDDSNNDSDSDRRVTPFRRGNTPAIATARANAKPVEVGAKSPVAAKAKPPAEPDQPKRRGAHRWI